MRELTRFSRQLDCLGIRRPNTPPKSVPAWSLLRKVFHHHQYSSTPPIVSHSAWEPLEVNTRARVGGILLCTPALHSCSAILLCNPALFFSLCRSLTSSPSGARLMAPHAQVSTARRARALGCAPPANPQHAVEPPSELPRGDSKRDFNTRRADRAFWLLSAGDR